MSLKGAFNHSVSGSVASNRKNLKKKFHLKNKCIDHKIRYSCNVCLEKEKSYLNSR